MVKSDFKKSGKTTWVWRTWGFWRKSMKKILEFITCRGVFEQKKAKFSAFLKISNKKIDFSPNYMADYAFGKC